MFSPAVQFESLKTDLSLLVCVYFQSLKAECYWLMLRVDRNNNRIIKAGWVNVLHLIIY